jgi:hypothetical protein
MTSFVVYKPWHFRLQKTKADSRIFVGLKIRVGLNELYCFFGSRTSVDLSKLAKTAICVIMSLLWKVEYNAGSSAKKGL